MGRPRKGEETADTRAAVTARELAEVLAASAAAIDDDLFRRKRLILPDAWPEIRRVVCLLPDAARRAALVELLRDERTRIAGEG